MEEVPAILSMVTPDGVPVMDELCRILERGEYGEHEALRRMLSADPGRRIATRGERERRVREDSDQMDLFG
jgi:hypothetical protein